MLDLIDKTNMNLKLKILADSLEEFGYPFIYIYRERERETERVITVKKTTYLDEKYFRLK